MKKLIALILCIMTLFSLASCGNSSTKQNEMISMFDSFDTAQNCIILTAHQLILGDTRYDLSEITYNGKQCNIVFLEETGFYSYTYDRDNLCVELLYTHFEDFKTNLLGTETIPSKIINAFWGDNCFWFRMDDPETDEFQQIYYSWNIDSRQATIVKNDEITNDYEYAMDSNRSKDFSFNYTSKMINSHLDITNNQTNITKRIDKSVLATFEEGKKMRKAQTLQSFSIDHVFERNGDVYFISYYEVGFLGSPCYYYVAKWNFETEECDFYTAFDFDDYQDRIVDMYIA